MTDGNDQPQDPVVPCVPYVSCGRPVYRILRPVVDGTTTWVSLQREDEYDAAALAFWVVTAHELQWRRSADRYRLENQRYHEVPIHWDRLPRWAVEAIETSGLAWRPARYAADQHIVVPDTNPNRTKGDTNDPRQRT